MKFLIDSIPEIGRSTRSLDWIKMGWLAQASQKARAQSPPVEKFEGETGRERTELSATLKEEEEEEDKVDKSGKRESEQEEEEGEEEGMTW